MTRSQRIVACSMSVLFAAAVFVFFRFAYPYHIHYQEQFQLFEFTAGYFAATASVPGGIADWIGRFLVQFFYYANAGAAIIAALAVLTQFLTYRATGKDNLPVFALCFVPSALIWIFLCDENALVGAVAGLAVALGSGLAADRIPATAARTAVKLAATPLVYFLAGPAAIAYTAVCFRREKPWKAAASVFLLCLCPLAAQYVWQYPLSRFFTGIHYYRYPEAVPVLFWAAAFCTLVIVIACRAAGVSRTGRKGGTAAGLALFAVVSVLTGVSVRLCFNPAKEEVMKYDFMTSHRMWNRTMMEADVKNPSTPLSVSCLNLALSMSGRMPASMFEYYQNGPEGLLPTFNREATSAMSLSEIYYHLGMVNTAQRMAFEAQESIPDFQKSARCYRMLSVTNIINGDYGVAQKYLESLKHTIFYSRWARGTEAVLYDDEAVCRDPEYARMRSLRFHTRDFLFSGTEMDSMLGLLYLENRSNSVALDYLLAWTLLKKDLGRFTECLGMVTAVFLPQPYQEAVILKWALDDRKWELPASVSRASLDSFGSFINDRQKGLGEDDMRRKYGKTYWFYYFYRYN